MNNLPFRHILVIEDEKSRRIVSLEERFYSIGRDATNSIIIYDRQVSRFHASLLREEDNNQNSYKVIDGDLNGNISTNGVVVNGKPILSHTLKHGDVIRFGEKAKALYHILSDPSIIALFKDGDAKEAEPIEKVNRVSKSTLSPEDFKTTLKTNKDLEELSQKELIRLASFPELSPNPIIEIDWQGGITYLNPAASLKFKDLYHLQTKHPILAGLTSNCQSKHGNLFVREVKIGTEIFEQYVHYLADSQLIRSYIFDFTKRKQMEGALRESEQLYRAVVRQSFEGIFLVDVATRRIIEANEAYCKLLGYSLEEVLGMSLEDLVIFNEEIKQEDLNKLLENNQDFVTQSRHRCQNGTLISLESSMTVINSRGRDVICFAVHRLNSEINSGINFKHPVTGLYNLEFFLENLLTSLITAQSLKKELALILLELDNYLEIEKILEKDLINECLLKISEQLNIAADYGGIIAHYNSACFAILLPLFNDHKDIAKLTQTLLNEFKEPIVLEKHSISFQVSIGISIYPFDGQEINLLKRNAESALQRSKDIGSNNYQFYSPTTTSKVVRTLRLEELLQNALENEELSLAYQPIVNIQKGMIAGMEALLRWENLELQRIPPSNLIALAEEMGLIIPLGDWVLQSACHQNYLWQQSGLSPLPLTINFSSQQFQDNDLVARIVKILQDSNLEPHWLELEITEKTIMENNDFIFKRLRDLLQLGIQISIDDFGWDYCSLQILKKFPFHTLKIHPSFVREIQDNPKDLGVISAMVALGKSFNMRVVAKGVEKIQQLKLLRRLECHEMQGYLFSEPLSTEDATNVLRKGNLMYLIP